jgi:hypothetical protein
MSYLAGVIDAKDKERFGRLVYRVTKGCTWTQTSEMKYDKDDPLLDSHSVILFYVLLKENREKS